MSIQKNRLHKNILKKKNNKNIFGGDVNISIRSTLHSVDVPEYYFNNFFKSKDDFYKNIEKTLKRLVSNPKLIEDFEPKGLNIYGDYLEKFRRIHQDTYGYVVESEISNKFIYRFSHKGNKAFQIYLFGSSESSEIIFIDLYHLLIPGADKEHGEQVKDPIKHYNRVKDYSVDLYDIVSGINKF